MTVYEQTSIVFQGRGKAALVEFSTTRALQLLPTSLLHQLLWINLFVVLTSFTRTIPSISRKIIVEKPIMNWFKQTLANVAGTQEPIYGPTAIQAVTEQAKTKPYTELTKDGLRWVAMDSTSVETQTFYVMAESGEIVMLQVIYSNVAGLRTTCQFNTKVMNPSDKANHLWYTNPVDNYGFDADQLSFFADNLSVALSEAGDSYTIKSAVNPDSIVDVTFKRATPGFVVGNDGNSFYGTDAKNPWGRMRHAFWPRCDVEGTIVASGKKFDVKGLGFFIHALQGMKPHHAAARWNFISFQSPSYSATVMEFTTPPSYGTTTVSIGGIVTPTDILTAGAITTATHTSIAQDSENEWPEPSAVKWEWNGKTSDDKAVTAVIEGPLGERLDRIDVMAEVPGFVKAIVASAAGTKPYIYQYAPETPVLKIKVGDDEQSVTGRYFSESTFIS